MSTTETQKPAYELTEDGEVIFTKKGKSTVLATYDEETGHLEFADKRADSFYRAQIIRAITEDTEGIQSPNKIKSMGIKGQKQDEPKDDAPDRPKASGLLGDKTPEVVEWYFRYRPQEAYVRYGVILDKSGEPVTAHCKRVEKRLGENPNTGLIEQQDVVTENEHGILATRQTHKTFLKTEVVGAQAGEAEEDEG